MNQVFNNTKVKSVRKLTVIEIKTTTGKGETSYDPIRDKFLYYTEDGDLIATWDTGECRICGAIPCTSDHK
jgi:hypothetical protein